MPRDSWLLDRRTIQPGPDFFDSTAGGYSLQIEASALATSIDDLFDRLEATGQLLRLDPMVRPAMYRCATVTGAEVEELRRIKNVVRMGRVRSIDAGEIALDSGTTPTSLDTLHIDCTADGLERRPAVPVFEGERITLQSVRTCQQVLSAAIIAHVEASYGDEERKNELCTPIPHPDSDIDWLRTTLANTINVTRWGGDPVMAAWLAKARLNINTTPGASPTPEQIAIIGRIGQHTGGAITNLQKLLDGVAA
jgi:hypothetical protein